MLPTIHAFVEGHAREHPDRPAIIAETRQQCMTFRQLDARAEVLAAALRGDPGPEGAAATGTDVLPPPVGVYATGVVAIVAQLAAMKAGAFLGSTPLLLPFVGC